MQRHESNKHIYQINYLISEVLFLCGKIGCYISSRQKTDLVFFFFTCLNTNFFLEHLNTNYVCTFIYRGDLRPNQHSHNLWKTIYYF
jgi:hypothetical protein